MSFVFARSWDLQGAHLHFARLITGLFLVSLPSSIGAPSVLNPRSGTRVFVFVRLNPLNFSLPWVCVFFLLLGPACTIPNTCLISVKNKRKQKFFFGFGVLGFWFFFFCYFKLRWLCSTSRFVEVLIWSLMKGLRIRSSFSLIHVTTCVSCPALLYLECSLVLKNFCLAAAPSAPYHLHLRPSSHRAGEIPVVFSESDAINSRFEASCISATSG